VKILALSYLFPDKEHLRGIFVYNRLNAIKKYCDIKVISPRPLFPLMNYFKQFRHFSEVPYYGKYQGLDIYRPRFFIIPKLFKWFDCVSYFFSTISVVSKIRLEFSFDIIDVHWLYPDIIAGYIFSKIFKKKLFLTVRGKEALFYGEKSLRRLILNYFLKKGDKIIALSSELKNLLVEIGVEDKRIHVIRNGVDIEKFYYLSKDKCRKKLNLPPKKKIILSIGSLTEGKGFQDIIHVLPQLANKHDVELYILGDVGPAGNYKIEIEDLIKKLGLSNIFLMGNRTHEELIYWYNAADIFCLASHSEGSPNVINEALACGIPVVSTAVGSIPDVLVKDFLGLTVSPGEYKDILEKLIIALDIVWDRQKISNYMKSFTWDWCAKQITDLYHSV